jgi:hypothetical protein
MGERLLGLAATTLEGRFLGRAAGRAAESRGAELQATESRAAESRAVESRVVRRAETFSASASDGSCATNLAMAGGTSESGAAARVAVRLVEGVSGAQEVGRSSESIARELADEASRGFLRARSHWASRACTSASTHSSKISFSSLRRLAKRYSRGLSMASSRDAETCFASPLELGIGLIDITRVITSYSAAVAVLVRGAGVGLAERTNAEMGLADRRLTEKMCGHARRLALSPMHRVRFRERDGINGPQLSNGAQARVVRKERGRGIAKHLESRCGVALAQAGMPVLLKS